MNNHYHNSIDIAKQCFVLSNVGNGWKQCWNKLLHGEDRFSTGNQFIRGWPDSPPLSIIETIADNTDFKNRTNDAAFFVASQMKDMLDDLFQQDENLRVLIVVATSHGDPGPLSTLVNLDAENACDRLTDDIAEGLLSDGLIASVNRGISRNLQGVTTSAACASSLVSGSYACDMIDFGIADAVLLVAVDTLSRVATVAFNNIGAMSQRGCMPYSSGRDGTTVGEGAVALLLARKSILKKEDVQGTIVATSVYCDAAHMVEPDPKGVAWTIQKALDQAELSTSDISAIYWHGTGTIQNDKTEAEAAQILFGESSPPCSSTKGVLGHTMGASGGFNMLAACETLQSGILPHVARSTDNVFSNLDVVLHEPRYIAPGSGVALVTALGFGGINAALILEANK